MRTGPSWRAGFGDARARSAGAGVAVADRAGGRGRDDHTEIAAQLGISQPTATKWRNRFADQGVDGLLDEPRPGRPRTISDEQVEEVVVRTLVSKPKDATHWSTRSMAAEVG